MIYDASERISWASLYTIASILQYHICHNLRATTSVLAVTLPAPRNVSINAFTKFQGGNLL